MEKELFGAIRDNYNYASDNLWRWHRRQGIFTRIITFIWIGVSSTIIKIIGFIFGLGVILDYISVWLQNQRNNFINLIDKSAQTLCYRKISYMSAPILAFVLAPIALIFGLIPKWSSTIVAAAHPDLDFSLGTEHGYFVKLGKSYLNLAKALFININKHGYFFILPALLIFIFSTPIVILISLVFFLLVVLDIIGWVVGLIRKFVILSSAFFAKKTDSNIVSIISMPILMILFVPIYIVLLLIPKIATYDET